MEQKTQLRTELRRWRRELSPAQRCLWDSDLAMRLLRLPQYRDADTVLCYLSSPEEVSTKAIVAHALAVGKRVGVPRWQAGSMVFCNFTDYHELHTDKMGLLQPDDDAPVLQFGPQTLCVVPALAADRDGVRLGYGGGYYDRFLAGFAGMSVCPVYRLLPQGTLPRQPHDIAARLVLAPEQTTDIDQREEANL